MSDLKVLFVGYLAVEYSEGRAIFDFERVVSFPVVSCCCCILVFIKSNG